MADEATPSPAQQAKATAAKLNAGLEARGVKTMRWIVTRHNQLRLVGNP